jgi:hypothetical protein
MCECRLTSVSAEENNWTFFYYIETIVFYGNQPKMAESEASSWKRLHVLVCPSIKK